MKRLVLPALAVAALAVGLALPGAANAAAPCRDRIYNDWYRDGKIASTYPLSCYRDAIKHVPGDAAIYSSLQDDIRSALQAAIARSNGRTVPTEVGHGLPTSDPSDVMSTTVVKTEKRSQSSAKTSKPAAKTPTVKPTQPLVAAPVASTSSSSGLPVPILVLGALALLLAGIGAVGAGVRHFRR